MLAVSDLFSGDSGLLVIVVPGLLAGGAVGYLLRGRIWLAQRSPEKRVAELVEQGAMVEAGDVWFRREEYSRALAFYLQSSNAGKIADCYLKLRQPKRAAEVLAEAGRLAEAAHHFQAASAWREAAECLHHLGSEREAAELYERAGELAKAANLLRTLGDMENAARLFERAGLDSEAANALLRVPGPTQTRLRRAGELFARGGDTRRAAECFAGIAEWARAAELFEEDRSFTRAGQAWERAERWERAAACYERAGSFREARVNYERAGDRNRAAHASVQMGSLLDAARAYYRIGSYERAIDTLQGIPEDSPQAREAQILLGRIFFEKGLLQRAADCLRPLIPDEVASKEDADLLLVLAEVHERAGDLAQAAELLEKTLRALPDHARAAERLESLLRRTEGDPRRSEGIRDHRYELRGELGRGGMAVVYLAQDRELRRPVAVKFLPESLARSTTALEMFRSEARAAAAMNHPNIIHLYDVGNIRGRPCIVMEYVPGRTVREIMRTATKGVKRPIPARRVAEIARGVASALHYAHGRGVIHRDVKPANILISETDQPKLMDFGISKILQTPGEGETKAKGTPQYMPPEQILGRAVDGRADVYALGISMFEMLTGHRPFRGEDVVDQQLHRPLPDPRETRPELPGEIVAIVARACAKDPAERFASALELEEALAAFLGPETPTGRTGWTPADS